MSAESSSTADASGAGSASGGSASASADDCIGGAPADGGCGQGGESVVEPYAGLHTACSHNVKVNRRGGSVPVDCHIR